MSAEPPSPASARDAAVAYLLGRINYEQASTAPYNQRELKLDRMRQLLAHLGHPDRGLPIIHVAGTKGKGSVAAFSASILREAGYDVGVFSSPHLERIEERLSVNGDICPPGEFAALVDELRPAVRQMDADATTTGDRSHRPTFFELTTALALMMFRRRKVDVAVLEVGLGGRLDSTNVCQPAVTAITSIGFDHTKQLGDTLPEIAAEKAGIVKPGVPLVLGPLDPAAYDVIAAIARRRGARTVETPRDYQFAYRPPGADRAWHAAGSMDLVRTGHPAAALADAALGLCGAHQAINAATAVAIVGELRDQGWLVSRDAVLRGLAQARLPGRIEVVGRQPVVVLDVAHNVASAAALAEFIRRAPPTSPRRLVLAATRDKDVAGIIRQLAPVFTHVWLTEYREAARGVPADDLLAAWQAATAEAATAAQVMAVTADPQAAWRSASADVRPDELIAVTGSFFLIAELRPAIRHTMGDDATCDSRHA